MVAVVSGNSLGLFNSSLAVLGSGGAVGNSAEGRAGERIFVNSATGNLIVQSRDEVLAATGLDLSLVRTYNSQGLLDDDNGDNWRLGVHERVFNLTGTVNTAGSTVIKTFGDGADVVYAYDTTLAAYVSTAGDGAHDTLVWNTGTSQWTWTDGSARNLETYDSTGKLLNSKDADGNTVTYTYTGSLLTQIADASGQTTFLDYTGNNLTQIRVVSQGVTQTITRYTYDGSNRLSQVRVDLSPSDNSIADNNVYLTTYTYEGTSRRIASIAQGSNSTVGSTVNFTYELVDTVYRLKTFVDGEGKTTTFTYTASGGGVSTQTDISTPLGLQTRLMNDSSGRLTAVLSPTVGGIRLETRYAYDADGNVTTITEDPTGLNRVTTNTYDANGNRTLTRDSLGNTVTRTYDGANQLVTETSYVVPDPDGAGAGQPSGPMTARFAYDSENHLRFVISGEGRVTEHRYDAAGSRTATIRYTGGNYDVAGLAPATALSESQLTTWIGTQNLALTERTDYAYDFRGNLQTATAYAATDGTGAGLAAGASITRYVYDQRGQLLSSIDPRGEATSGDPNDYVTTFTYDGLGRVLTSVRWTAAGNVSTLVNAYNDGTRTNSLTLANGLVTTTTFDRVGRVLTVNASAGASLGTTTYTYDVDGRLRMVTDPIGVRTHSVYDDAGRKIFTVDGDGTLTEFVYDRASNVVKTVEYAVAANTALVVDSGGVPIVNVDTTALRDSANGQPAQNRISRAVYDASHRVVFTIDAGGNLTKNSFDGASRVTDSLRYATPVTISASVNELVYAGGGITGVTITTSADDRLSRIFHDNEGLVLGTLDGAGYLIRNVYGGGGEVIESIAYANVTQASLRATGTLAQLEASITPDATKDIVSYAFYDGQGRRIGAIDGAKLFTQWTYDTAGNVLQEIRYPNAVTFTGMPTFAGVLPGSTAGAHITAYQYDEQNHVTRTTNFEGTITEYKYDNVGNLIQTTTALGTDPRVSQARYDALGRVIAELTPEGSVAIAALGGSPTQAQIDAVWNAYGVKYAYDLAGRRISTTDQNGNVTLFYYDADRRVRFTVALVEGSMGEVAELRYNALGQVTSRLSYTNRISTAGLTGGDVTSTLTTRVTAAVDATKDSVTTYTYTLTGRVATETTAAGGQITNVYNAFGELFTSAQLVQGTTNLEHRYSYDQRGLLLTTRWDPNGLNTTETRVYDAFGRVTSSTDQNGNTSTRIYDRLGRELSVVDALNNTRSTTYDAFSRVLSVTDALNKTSTFAYDDAARSVVVTTPEGVSVATIQNRHGQTAQVTDARGNVTVSEYDANGRLIRTSDSLGTLAEQDYDVAGRLLETRDALGNEVVFSYDAANRVLTRTVDPTGLAQVTTFAYDGQGRTVQTTDANGAVTTTAYDNAGRVTAIVVDPAGLALRTEFAYTLRGDVVRVTEGAGSANPRVTDYVYDVLGRRTREIVDPAGLALTTQFEYDANGNVVRRIDPKLAATRFVYDADDRLRFTIDALNGVTDNAYDADGRVARTTRYATAIDSSGFGAIVSVAAVQAVLVTSGADRTEQTVFDRDGRAVYTIDNQGGVTQRFYDANGNVARSVFYSERVASATYTTVAQVQTALAAVADGNSANDRESRTVYDARNRAAFTIDGAGDVVRSTFDAAGNVVATTQFATQRTDSGVPDLATMQTWAAANPDPAQDRTTRIWYDAANRAVFTLDAEGFLAETGYDAVGRATDAFQYFNAPVIGAGATIDDVRNTVVTDPRDRHTTTSYDAAGRIEHQIDAAGVSESYTYDSVGNRLTFTNKKGSTWHYVYDANRRLVEEHSPSVAITTVADVAGNLTGTTSSAEIVTRMTYDALGNVLTRTEAYGRPEARTTSYVYDALGRQVRTNFPPLNVYDAGSDSLTRFGTAVVRTETPASLFNQVVYDTLGNAVRNQDVAGNYSHKVYDKLGRVRYEIDQERYVTEYRYDTFGNVTDTIRYANKLNDNGITAATILSEADVAGRLVPSATTDRTITNTYDRVNRLAKTEQPAVYSFEPFAGVAGGDAFTARPTTTNTYNAFGQLVRQSQLVNPTIPLTADTYFYFDQRGKLVGQVDALGNVTTSEYDAYGDLTRQVEHSKALATGTWNLASFSAPVSTTPSTSPGDPAGYDRDTRYAYDALDRLTSETRFGVEFSQISGQTVTTSVGNDVTTYGYDALGNQTRITKQTGGDTFTYYDVLGRVIATAEPARDPGNGTSLTPLVEMHRDAFGNVVEQAQYANGASAAAETSYTAAAGPARATRFARDGYGNALRTQDPVGANRYASYDARGEVAKEWQYVTNDESTVEALVSIYEYDRVGRQLHVREPQTLPANGNDPTPVLLSSSDTSYNAFGEITFKGVNGSQEYFDYDQAGRVWRTNKGDGVDKVYFYNLAGQATVEIRSPWIALKSGSFTTPLAVANIAPSAVYRTETRYDVLGHVVEQRLPAVSTQTVDSSAKVLSPSIGDVATSNNPAAGYRRVPTGFTGNVNGQQFYWVPSATLEDGGGYYLASDGSYVQDPNYQVLHARYVSWAAPSDLNATVTFEYRPSGDPNAEWTAGTVVSLPGNRVGVNVDELALGTYEYRIRHTRPGSVVSFERADGEFTIAGVPGTGLAITIGEADDAGTVRPISATRAGGISWEIVQQQEVGDWYNQTLFWVPGTTNEVVFHFAATPGPVTIEFDYMTTAFPEGPNYPSAMRTMVLTFDDGSLAPAGLHAFWNDPFAQRAGGVSQVVAARVYASTPPHQPSSIQTLYLSTKEQVQSDVLHWRAPRDPTVQATFQVRRAGATEWTEHEIEREGSEFIVDPSALDSGDWEYQVTYVRDGQTTAISGGRFRVSGSDLSLDDYVDLFQDTSEPFHEVPNDQLAVTPLRGIDSGPIDIGDIHSEQQPWGTGSSLPVDDPHLYQWTGSNSVDLTWTDVGDGPVKVELDYVSEDALEALYRNATEKSSSIGDFRGPGWLFGYIDIHAGVEMTRSFEFSSAAEGASLSWTDDPNALNGGIFRVRQVRVYTQDGEGNWVLAYTRDGAASIGGRSVQWGDIYSDESTFEIRAVGTEEWTPLTIDNNFGGNDAVDLNSFADGEYEYRISQVTSVYNQQTDEVAQVVQATAMGVITLGPNGVGVTQTGIVYGDGAGDLGPVTADANTLSWSHAPAANTTITVRHRNFGSSVWQEQTVTGTGPDFSAVLAGADKGAIDYEILYVADGEVEPYAKSTGTLIRDLDHLVLRPRGQLALTNHTILSTSPLPVEGITSDGQAFNWTTAKEDASDTIEFRYWQGTDPAQTLTITTTPTGYAVDTASLADGTYNYEIRYVRDGETDPYANGVGTFRLYPIVIGGSPSITNTDTSSPSFLAETPTIEQTVDRWGNALAVADALGNTTDYVYNQADQVVRETQPLVGVYDTRVGTSLTIEHPVIRNHYDLSGRLIGSTDANGNVTSAGYNAAGEVIVENHADGGVKHYVYDAFGNQTDKLDELGFDTRSTYDGANRLTKTEQELVLGALGAANQAQILTQSFAYDESGRRIRETNDENETTQLFYDLQGNVRRRRSPRGFETKYVYDTQGNKTRETDPLGNTLQWTYDYFGRLTSQRDLSNILTSYGYDLAGHVTLFLDSYGKWQTFTYDVGGRLTRIADTGTATFAAQSQGLESSSRQTDYEYDLAGHRTHEKLTIDGVQHTDARMGYDALGRLVNVWDLRYALGYGYDAQGNRTRAGATYYEHTQAPTTTVLWYRYDDMNRVAISQGADLSGAVGIDPTQGIELTYDLAGQRKTARSYGQVYDEYDTYVIENGFPVLVPAWQTFAGYSTETYSYDGGGRLLSVDKDDVRTDVRAYDGASRELSDQTTTIENGGLTTRLRTSAYDDDGRTTSQSTSKNGRLESVVSYGDSVPGYYDYWTQGFDAAGNLRGYSVAVYDNGSPRYTSYYTSEYRLGQFYQETRQTVHSTRSAGAPSSTQVPLAGETTRTYNVNGELVKLTDVKDLKKSRSFANNASGEATTVVQGDFGTPAAATAGFRDAIQRRDDSVKAQHFFFVNDHLVGSFGQLQDDSGAFKANFDTNYTAISADYPPSVPGQVVVQAGETLRIIAQRIFGDAALWYVLAEENGLTDPDSALREGTLLKVPNEVVSLANNATSFKPFNVTDALGDTTPTQPAPPPPKKKGCGVLGQILIIVVAVVVSFYLTPVVGNAILEAGLGTAAAGVATGAVVGATVSVATQATAIAVGLQDGFSWRSVALGALSGAATGALSVTKFGHAAEAAGKGGAAAGEAGKRFGQLAAYAAATSAINQGVAVLTGTQEKFSWRDVAISSLAAPVVAIVDKRVGQPISKGVTKSLATNAIRRAFGGKVDAETIATDAFQNALGNYLDDHAQAALEQQRVMERINNGLAAYEAAHPLLPESSVPIPNVGFDVALDNNPELAIPEPVTLDEQREARTQQMAAEARERSQPESTDNQIEEFVVTGRRMTAAEAGLQDLHEALIAESHRSEEVPGESPSLFEGYERELAKKAPETFFESLRHVSQTAVQTRVRQLSAALARESQIVVDSAGNAALAVRNTAAGALSEAVGAGETSFDFLVKEGRNVASATEEVITGGTLRSAADTVVAEVTQVIRNVETAPVLSKVGGALGTTARFLAGKAGGALTSAVATVAENADYSDRSGVEAAVAGTLDVAAGATIGVTSAAGGQLVALAADAGLAFTGAGGVAIPVVHFGTSLGVSTLIATGEANLYRQYRDSAIRYVTSKVVGAHDLAEDLLKYSRGP